MDDCLPRVNGKRSGHVSTEKAVWQISVKANALVSKSEGKLLITTCKQWTVNAQGMSRLCSEISCNVKWNVYLAMKIPDCVSFVSG